MVWFGLAWKNILRRPVRSSLTVLGVAIAIAVLFSLLDFQRGYERGLREELNALGAHIMIVPKGCPYEAATIVLHGGKWPRYMEQSYLDIVHSTPGVAQSTGILMDAIIEQGGAKNEIYLGIDSDYPALRSQWDYAAGGWFPDDNSAILGATTAEQEGLKVGDPLVIADPSRPALGKHEVRVAGILKRTHTQDDGMYFLPVKAVQRIFQLSGKLVVILIKVQDMNRIDQVVRALKETEASMNVFPLSELLSTMTTLMRNTKVFVLAIVLVAILIGAVGVLNTILMAVFERTKEIGMMKAVGSSRLDIFRLIWTETLMMCLAGGLGGIALALITARIVEAFVKGVLPYAPSGTLISFSSHSFLVCLAFSLVLGLLAGIYPAYRAASVRPMEAIRGA